MCPTRDDQPSHKTSQAQTEGRRGQWIRASSGAGNKWGALRRGLRSDVIKLSLLSAPLIALSARAAHYLKPFKPTIGASLIFHANKTINGHENAKRALMVSTNVNQLDVGLNRMRAISASGIIIPQTSNAHTTLIITGTVRCSLIKPARPTLS